MQPVNNSRVAMPLNNMMQSENVMVELVVCMDTCAYNIPVCP